MLIFILLVMIFCHIIDDFVLQSFSLVKLKQKAFWRSDPEYNEKYRNDYLIALFFHSFSWAFMIMLPLFIYFKFNIGFLYFCFPINLIIHFVIDDLKANKRKINLVQDQLIHLLQISLTFIIFVLVL